MLSPCYRKQRIFFTILTPNISFVLVRVVMMLTTSLHEVSYFEAFNNGRLMDMVGGVA